MAPDKRKFNIHIETQEKGPEGLPLVSFAAGEEPIILVKFTFDNECDSRGGEVVARFRAGADIKVQGHIDFIGQFLNYQTSFARKEWKLDVPSPKSGYLAKGHYTKAIALELNPRWPSTVRHFTASGKGWVRYMFSMTLDKMSSSFSLKKMDMMLEQEVWVVLPGDDTLGASIPPTVSLPVEQSPFEWRVRSNRVHAGEVVPFELRCAPLQPGSPFFGDATVVVITKAEMELRQEVRYYSSTGNEEFSDRHTMLDVVTTTGWPDEIPAAEAWERVLYMVIPGVDKIKPSFKTSVFRCTHKVKLRVTCQIGHMSHCFKSKFDIHIGRDALLANAPLEELPMYTNESNVEVRDSKEGYSQQ
ncbi:hypothetical protein DFQ27_009256 [Actinomortierella ambigua]|uniref:Arrestin-like N-terminal domain-containing protein n=1 Tax=Actinomortierella ambigua TaxID=1343610 RepID=A0A9P6QF04_9FUNG|nr:hypothetical protein DFQ27_009256 [Actinomortierella ambigua]